MQVMAIDERRVRDKWHGWSFVVFIYQGDDTPDSSWSVHSYILTDTDLSGVLQWLVENLPVESCWSLGVVTDPERPTVDSDMEVAWVVGADVLNKQRCHWSPTEEHLAEAMLARRHRVTLP